MLVVGEESCRDSVALEQAARVPGVLGEDDVGRAQLGEHPQCDVLEFPIGVAQTASGIMAPLERDEPRTDQTCPAPSSAARSEPRPAGASASARTAGRAAGSRKSNAGDAEAAADHDHLGLKMLTSDPIATPRW